MADIKAELKSARECIKKKEYKEALKHCKNVLKVDKVNYNGLVFIGVCATELEQFDQARQAYKKAIEVNEGHILAWQGLGTCLEKANNSSWYNELIEAYSKLLENHIKEDGKWSEYCNKLVSLLKREKKYKDAVGWIKESIKKCEEPKDTMLCWKEIITILKDVIRGGDTNPETLSELLASYQSLLEVSENVESDIEEVVVEYIRFLLQYAKVDYCGKLSLDAIMCTTKKMFGKYRSNSDILCMLCMIWMHLNIDHLIPDENTSLYFDKLLELQPNSFAGYMVSGLVQINDNNTSQAIERFQKALTVKKNEPFALYMIAKCQFALHQHQMTSNTARSCQVVLSNMEFKETASHVDRLLLVMNVDILLEGEITEKKRKEIEMILEKLIDAHADKIEVVLLRIKVHIKFDEIESAIKLLGELEEISVDNVAIKNDILQVKAYISIHEGKFYDAELRLHEALELKEESKSHFLLGEVYKSLAEGGDQLNYPKAYNSYLKAAKLDPFYSTTFLRLGEYQHDFIKNFDKSMKCFEKALSLDPMNEAAVKCLGDLYLELDMEEKAVALYSRFTSKSNSGDAIWAWVRLGLLNLKINADKAVVCFQHAIRGETGISHYWECLAEAYICKGSYTSALKAFTKASELDPSSAFCKYKIAKIKQMLCMDSEAIQDYEKLLESNPSYFPGLLGLAETHLHLQREKLKATLDGRAIDHAQKVIEYISLALREQPTYTCLWKTVADSLCVLHAVTNDKCKLEIPENLRKILSLDVKGLASKEMIMDIATKCYMMAIKFHENVASLWNDLAVCTFYHGMILKGQSGEKKIHQSIEIIKKALTLDPDNHILWNTLGVIAGSPGPSQKVCGYRINDIQNPGLSQHAFIKSLQINDLDAQVWCNLGTLYLQYEKIMPAHEAFKRAQAADPSLVQAWVGQAIIAECIGDDEAMDLFRHTTQLSFHGEGSIAYAQFVCHMLKSIAAKSTLVVTRPAADMSHLPEYARNIVANASVALQKSVERHKSDPCAFNTLGLLLEQQALYKQAEVAFSCARKLLNVHPDQDRQAELLRMVLINQARVLCELKKFDDAIEIYNIVSLQTVTEYCGLALAYYASGQLNKSFSTYEKALSISDIDGERSSLLSAMGMVQYAMKDADAAKMHLLKGSQFEEKAEHGLMALAALGLLHGDGTLTTAALVEISNHKLACTASLVEKKTMLLSAFYMLQGQSKAAQRTLSKAILRFPNNAYLWCQLSKYIIENNAKQYKSALHCAKAALLMGQSKVTSKTDAIASLAFPDNLCKSDFIKSVQRFVHNHPEHSESWVLLSTALMADLARKGSAGNSSVIHMTNLALTKVDDTLNHLRQASSKLPSSDNKLLSMYTSLYSWTMQSYVMAHIYYGDVSMAHSFCNQIIPSLNGDKKAQEQFIFLKGLATMQENFLKNDVSGLENLRVMAAITTKDTVAWKWLVMSQLYVTFSMPTSVELCLRNVMKINLQKNMRSNPVLYSMCLLCMQAYHVSQKQSWLDKGLEVIAELTRSDESNPLTIFLRALLFHQEGKQKAAVKYLQKLTFCDDLLINELQQKLLEQWK